MTPALPWLCMVCVVLGGTLGRASLHAELGVSIHPAFSTSLYIAKDPQISEDPREKDEQGVRQSQAAACEILSTTESGPDVQQVKTLPRKTFSFFVKPESSFRKLVVKLSLQNVFYVSEDFFSDDGITLNSEDLTHPVDTQWTHVKVEHYQHRRRGFDRHGFRVSFANTTLSHMTRDSWIMNGFKSFTVFAEGGAKILLNCAPEDLDKAPVTGYMLHSMWVMAGLMIMATVLLAALCFVWGYIKYQQKKHSTVSPRISPMYDEFDEEVLERVRQKVEALRKGKSVANPDTVVVSYAPRQENLYVLEGTRCGGVEGVSCEEHHYEDIEKYYTHLYTTDNVYQNTANSGHNVSAVDNIYDSLPCFENYVGNRGDEARTSSRDMTS